MLYETMCIHCIRDQSAELEIGTDASPIGGHQGNVFLHLLLGAVFVLLVPMMTEKRKQFSTN